MKYYNRSHSIILTFGKNQELTNCYVGVNTWINKCLNKHGDRTDWLINDLQWDVYKRQHWKCASLRTFVQQIFLPTLEKTGKNCHAESQHLDGVARKERLRTHMRWQIAQRRKDAGPRWLSNMWSHELRESMGRLASTCHSFWAVMDILILPP